MTDMAQVDLAVEQLREGLFFRSADAVQSLSAELAAVRVRAEQAEQERRDEKTINRVTFQELMAERQKVRDAEAEYRRVIQERDEARREKVSAYKAQIRAGSALAAAEVDREAQRVRADTAEADRDAWQARATRAEHAFDQADLQARRFAELAKLRKSRIDTVTRYYLAMSVDRDHAGFVAASPQNSEPHSGRRQH